MSKRTGLGLLLVLTAVLLAWPFVVEFIAVDGCLDSGGLYDYASGACER